MMAQKARNSTISQPPTPNYNKSLIRNSRGQELDIVIDIEKNGGLSRGSPLDLDQVAIPAEKVYEKFFC